MNSWNFKEDRNLRSYLKMRDISEAPWHDPVLIVNEKYWPNHKEDYPILEILDRGNCWHYPLYKVRILQHPNKSVLGKTFKVSPLELYKMMTSINIGALYEEK